MSVAEHPTLAELRRLDLFDELDDEELARWVEVSIVQEAAPGEVIYDARHDESLFRMLLEGEITLYVYDGERVQPSGRQIAPTWIGAVPVLTETPLSGRLEAATDLRVASVRPEDFIPLVLSQPTVHRRIMRVVRPVANRFAALDASRERLQSLGTMSAGLAHELNNPASAAQSAAANIAVALDILSSTIGVFVESGIEREQAAELVELQREAIERAKTSTPLSGLDASDAEDDLREALEDLDVPESWKLVEPLAAAGLDRDWLNRLAASAGPVTGAAVAWVAASVAARGLATELAESTQRMSKLVKAIKAYAFMDRGELVETDVHEGLETTLVVLGHKLKHTAIDVQRSYDRSLPKVTVRGSELNQVWTNLLANAIEALGESGTITISTVRDGPCIRVDIADDGPGIPADVLPHIFDPFYTTKGVGQGTGLGLDAARRIIVERHNGSIDAESEPGRTVFRVWLPLDAAVK